MLQRRTWNHQKTPVEQSCLLHGFQRTTNRSAHVLSGDSSFLAISLFLLWNSQAKGKEENRGKGSHVWREGMLSCGKACQVRTAAGEDQGLPTTESQEIRDWWGMMHGCCLGASPSTAFLNKSIWRYFSIPIYFNSNKVEILLKKPKLYPFWSNSSPVFSSNTLLYNIPIHLSFLYLSLSVHGLWNMVGLTRKLHHYPSSRIRINYKHKLSHICCKSIMLAHKGLKESYCSLPFMLLPAGFLCKMFMILPRLFIRPSNAGSWPSWGPLLTYQEISGF